MTEALSWIDDEQLAARLVRRGDPSWADIVSETELVSYDPLLPTAHKPRGSHVGRG